MLDVNFDRAFGNAQFPCDQLIAFTRRDALQAMVQGFETRQPLWFERSRSLQLQADNILLQMRLRRSLEAAGR